MFMIFSALMARLEAKLGPSSETLRVIRQEMERDYYNADPRLVDPLLARCEHPSCFSHALGTWCHRVTSSDIYLRIAKSHIVVMVLQGHGEFNSSACPPRPCAERALSDVCYDCGRNKNA